MIRRGLTENLERNGQSCPELAKERQRRHAAQRLDFAAQMRLIRIARVECECRQSGVAVGPRQRHEFLEAKNAAQCLGAISKIVMASAPQCPLAYVEAVEQHGYHAAVF